MSKVLMNNMEATDLLVVADAETAEEGLEISETEEEILLAKGISIKPVGPGIIDGGFDPGFEEGTLDPTMGNTLVKDPLLSSWIFIAGISAAVLFVSVALGALLARRKIKKGIELYED